MTPIPLLLSLNFLWLAALAAEEAAPSSPPVSLAASEGVGEQAKRDGWKSACLAVDLIVPVAENFPGLKAWLADFNQADDVVSKTAATAPFPDLKINDLLSRNPHFWQAYYEVIPGDPGLALLHSGLLLAGGEAQRASVIAMLGLQRPGVPDSFRKALQRVIDRAYAAQQPALKLTEEGIALHDQGKYQDALSKYDAALRLWPNCGWTHYERGFTLRTMAKKVAAEKSPDAKVDDPPEVARAFARARQHDPFQMPAYQGAEPEVIQGLKAMANKIKPVWTKLEENATQLLSVAELKSLAEGCQEASIHDYALATHSVLVARHQRYAPKDHIWISESLAAIAPGPATETAMQSLEGAELRCVTLVPIEPAKEEIPNASPKAE